KAGRAVTQACDYGIGETRGCACGGQEAPLRHLALKSGRVLATVIVFAGSVVAGAAPPFAQPQLPTSVSDVVGTDDYVETEQRARDRLGLIEISSGAESLDTARALDALVDALVKNGKGG